MALDFCIKIGCRSSEGSEVLILKASGVRGFGGEGLSLGSVEGPGFEIHVEHEGTYIGHPKP